jgi:hypothetical protein
MKLRNVTTRERSLLMLLLMLNVAPRCSFVTGVNPYTDVDPATVDPVDPSATPTDRYRSIDGTGNHLTYFDLGAANTPLTRLAPTDYSDGMASLAGTTRASAREVSNAICADTLGSANALGASDFLWQWGQFLDHDIDLTEAQDPAEPAAVLVPLGDAWFDPNNFGIATIQLNRSAYHHGTGYDPAYPRQQLNQITHYIDASNVYGSNDIRAALLRANDGTGRLIVSPGDLLPFNTLGFPNAGGTGPELFLAGDVRANEQVGLTALHTLFVREHNRLAAETATGDPSLTDEQIYQEARRIVGALMQGITYNEFLPALLGRNALPPYIGQYIANVSPAIANEFSTAIYRFGHSALSPTLLRLDSSLLPIPEGHLALRDAFFRPDRILDEGGIEPLLRGLAAQACSSIDTELVDDVRNFLFGPPGAGGFDLAALNIQRGRDHGLPNYNAMRVEMGLEPKASFSEISADSATQARLASVYANVDDIDLWVGVLAEDSFNGGHVGELAFHVIRLQFDRLRGGDRYWYQVNLSPSEVADIESTTLADVIRRNTSIGAEISDDVFRVN